MGFTNHPSPHRVPQILSLVHQQLYPLPACRHVVDILHHYVSQLVYLAVHLLHDGRGVARLVEAPHLEGQHLRKFRVHPVGDGSRHGQAVLSYELARNLLEEDESAAPLKLLRQREDEGGWI